ncbi:MAG: OB-fold nucleic acid binding domain-containing protein, partial [Candidatus Gastranaerophilales bacterium]|nr:OB-fold nucleic acid binding domain-containing protein [Candidatus Gastranaerophilales bacterium]
MGREEQIINERIKKLEELKKKGINPYPNKYDKKETCAECTSSKIGAKVKTAGRLMTKRDLGKIAFCVLKDGTGKIQIVIQEKETPDKSIDLFKNYVDSGDFVGVEGKIIKTKTGEISILVNKIEILSKATLPLPEKWKGLQNDEDRYRKRYLDIIMNDEVKDMFIRKSKFWQSIRSFLLSKGFMEVETPVLENTPGGAEAKPFITHHNALNSEVYLRISPELWLKRLM